MTGPADVPPLAWVPCGSCAGQGRIRLHVAGPSYLCASCLGTRERMPVGSLLLARNDTPQHPRRRPFHGWTRPDDE